MTVSIITVNRNNREGLRLTLESVLSQTVPPYEFIVVDGASTDGGVEVLQEYSDRLTWWVSEPDAGIYNAMNKGVAHATGEWCLFLNSGDRLCDPSVMERLDTGGAAADIICGNAVLLDNPPRRKTPPESITMRFLYDGSLCHQSALIRTEILRHTGYDESLRIVADRKLFLQALILDGRSYERVDVDIADYDTTGLSSRNPLASRQEWSRVLEATIPERILEDYGKAVDGQLYGTTPYEGLFLEISRRNYRKPVYRLVRSLLGLVSVFVKSARFARTFPKKLS